METVFRAIRTALRRHAAISNDSIKKDLNELLDLMVEDLEELTNDDDEYFEFSNNTNRAARDLLDLSKTVSEDEAESETEQKEEDN